MNCSFGFKHVRDHIPLEQGLRLHLRDPVVLAPGSQRPYSIRTRIKTLLLRSSAAALSTVRDHIPLEQGLRLSKFGCCHTYLIVRDHIPLEQGLRPGEHSWSYVLKLRQRPYSIRTRIKTRRSLVFRPVELVRDHIPLEQGLRHKPQLAQDRLIASETIFH